MGWKREGEDMPLMIDKTAPRATRGNHTTAPGSLPRISSSVSSSHPRDTLDDLSVVRNIFHGNIFLCLLIVQFLFLFGIDQTHYKVSLTLWRCPIFCFCPLSSVRLSDHCDSPRLLPSGDVLVDVRRYLRIVHCDQTYLQDRSDPSSGLFVVFLRISIVNCLSGHSALY